MEAAGFGSRQSGFTPVTSSSSSKPDHFDQRPRDSQPQPQQQQPAQQNPATHTSRESSAMATAALISPSTPYGAHPPSFSPSYAPPQPSSGGSATIAGMISPVESRRTSDDNEASYKTALPSISEVMKAQKPPPPGSSPYPPPTTTSTSQSYPAPPFSAPSTSRPYSDLSSDNQPSPRSMAPAPSFVRTEPPPAFSDPSRPPFSARAGPPPPLNTYAGGPHPSPPPRSDQYDYEHHRGSESSASRLNGGYSAHSHASSTQMPYSAPPTGGSHLPPGQLPLSGYPVSPRHPPTSGSSGPMPSPYELPQRPSGAEEASSSEYGSASRPRYDPTVQRHYEQWGHQDRPSDHLYGHNHSQSQHAPQHPHYPQHNHQPHHSSSSMAAAAAADRSSVLTESWSQLAASTRVVYNFAETYGKLAQEHLTGNPIVERLPSDRQLLDMISHVDAMRSSLLTVQELVRQTVASERLPEAGNAAPPGAGVGSVGAAPAGPPVLPLPPLHKPRGPYEDEDIPMGYGEASRPAYTMNEVKKRRGRAAPPGRCHSCNRMDTPEWRRGPDGARTLCNACGLHYAKLERKRLLESRAARPKPVDERN